MVDLLIVIGPFFAFIFVALIFVLLVGSLKTSRKNKKIIFTASFSFLFFPVLVPVGIVTVLLPLPNIIFMVLSLYYPLDMFAWYQKTWTFALPSLLITGLLARGIAAMAFYEAKKAQ